MKLRKRWLSAALVFQVVLAVFLMWRADSPMASSGQTALFSVSREEVDRVLIDDGDSQLTLVKQDNQWRFKDASGLPVDPDKIDRFMDDVFGFKPGIPVITQQSSFARFEVADDAFYRHVTLYQGDKSVAAFYVGTTPAMNQAYVRLDNSEEVYAFSFNRYQLSMGTNGWLDKGLLQAGDITALEHEGWQAEKRDDGWFLTQWQGEALETEPDPEPLISLVDTLAQMQVTGLAKDVNKDDLQLHDHYTVTGDQQWTYKFYQLEDEKFATRSDVDAVFKITNHVFDQVVDVDFSDLLTGARDDEDQQNESSESSEEE